MLGATTEIAQAARQIATAAEEASAASREASTAATQQSAGAEDLAAAIEEIATLADEFEGQRDPDVKHAVQPSSSRRFLTFRVEGQLYALRSEDVAEVIRVPVLARVPQGPAALPGLANLRGSVLPVAWAAGVARQTICARTANGTRHRAGRAGAPVAVVVDSVAALESVDAGQIETRQAGSGARQARKSSSAGSQQARISKSRRYSISKPYWTQRLPIGPGPVGRARRLQSAR